MAIRYIFVVSSIHVHWARRVLLQIQRSIHVHGQGSCCKSSGHRPYRRQCKSRGPLRFLSVEASLILFSFLNWIKMSSIWLFVKDMLAITVKCFFFSVSRTLQGPPWSPGRASLDSGHVVPQCFWAPIPFAKDKHNFAHFKDLGLRDFKDKLLESLNFYFYFWRLYFKVKRRYFQILLKI